MKPRTPSEDPKWVAIVVVLFIVLGGTAVSEGSTSDSTKTGIDSCTKITEPGAYVLTTSITNSTAENCIEIRTDHVVLEGRKNVIDGGGFRGTTTHGITVNVDSSNVTITNLTVTNWAIGLSFNASNGRITDVEAVSNFGSGIALARSEATTLSNVTAVENEQTGIHLLRTKTITITESTVRENFEGIWFRETADSKVTDTRIIENNGTGAVLLASRDSTVKNVTANSNAVGISFINTTQSTMMDSRALRNIDGIRVAQSRRNTLTDNLISRNSFDGISLENSVNNTVTESTVTANNFVGVRVENGSSNRFSDLFIADNNGTVNYLTIWLRGRFGGASGIVLDESSGNSFTDIVARNNRNWTFYAINGSANVVENLSLESATISFRGTDVAVAPVETPPQSPPNYTSVGGHVAVTGLDDSSWLRLEMQYDQTAVPPTNVSEAALRLWRYDGSWTPVGGRSAETGVNVEQNDVYANLTNLSIVTPLAPTQPLPRMAFPSKPSQLTSESVPQFVAAHEETRVYNELFNESTRPLLELNVFCDPAKVERYGDGFRSRVRCGWSAVEVSPRGQLVAVDGAGYTTTYFINDTTTRRLSKSWGTSTSTGDVTTFSTHGPQFGSFPPTVLSALLLAVGVITARIWSSERK